MGFSKRDDLAPLILFDLCGLLALAASAEHEVGSLGCGDSACRCWGPRQADLPGGR